MNETLNAEKPPGSAAAICSPVKVALSIRQPWAWLILNAGKNVENRTWPTRFRGWFLIHAGKGMTQEEYLSVKLWLPTIGRSAAAAHLPDFKDLERGGIVGMAKLGNCVTGSDSPWFCGPYGFMLDEVIKLPFRPLKGALGFFNPGNVEFRNAASGAPGLDGGVQ